MACVWSIWSLCTTFLFFSMLSLLFGGLLRFILGLGVKISGLQKANLFFQIGTSILYLVSCSSWLFSFTIGWCFGVTRYGRWTLGHVALLLCCAWWWLFGLFYLVKRYISWRVFSVFLFFLHNFVSDFMKLELAAFAQFYFF